MQPKHLRPETLAIHAGNFEDNSRSVTNPIVLSTTFERGEDGISLPGGYLYNRYDNPNRHALEDKLAALENGAQAITFASGLTAAMAVMQTLGTGSHVILPDDIYFGVRNIIATLYERWGLSLTAVDMSNPKNVQKAIQKNTKLIWMETPSNPRLKLCDITAIAEIAKAKNILTACDNTWGTPYFQRPLELGVDISMHSTTKYLGGHCDILGGALIFREKNETSEFIKNYQTIGGAVPSPFDCWLLCRSLATFPARMPIHAKNAQTLANFLTTHPKIETVLFPGLKTDPYHKVAKKQMKNGFGGMLSILVKGGQESALKLTKNLEIFTHATSLGGVESLIEHRKSVEGIHSASPDNLLRVSVGLENVNDLIDDFTQALSSI
jgi:cystathionine gamma-synthase